MASRKATWLSSIPRSTLSRAAKCKPNLRPHRRASRSRHALGAITFRSEANGHLLVELREVERNCAITIDAPEKQASAIGLLAKHHYISAWGTAMERFDMRPLTSVFVVLILAIAPVTM